MKSNYLLVIVIACILFACEKTDDTLPTETKATIGGITFNPSESFAKKTGSRLMISFNDEIKTINIITNDTIQGIYVVSETGLKSASVLKAFITYSENNKNYTGTFGEVEIIKDLSGNVMGTYHTTVSDGVTTLEINGGSFTGIMPEIVMPFLESETAIVDTLDWCYSKLNDYIRLAYVFDAVYSNKIPSPGGSWDEVYNHSQNQSPENEKVLILWSDAYHLIHKLNLIAKSSELFISDEETRNQITAQVKAMRAYLFYTLMTWFGEIPLDEEFYPGQNPRGAIAEVINKITEDSGESMIHLPETWPATDLFRIPKDFLLGLLARVYLTDFTVQNQYPTPKLYLYGSDYDKTIPIARQIINSAIYALQADAYNFPAKGSEVIWGFEKGDDPEFNQVYAKGAYVPMMRLTEVYLILSEALYQNGNTADALSYINHLNSRSGHPIAASITPEVLYQHWNTELVAEGSMFLVQKRFNKAFGVVNKNPVKILLPIPLSAIIENPYLTQNMGY